MVERLAIFGSCVSRDTIEFADPRSVRLETYIARQSLAAAFAPKRDVWADAEAPKLDSPFQRSAVERDLRGKFAELVEASRNVDLVLMDLVDERGGVLRFADGSSLTKSLELSNSGFLDTAEEATWLKFGSDAHFEAWETGVSALDAALARAGLLDKVVFIKNAWASVSLEGDTFPFNESRLDPVAVNAMSERYWDALSARGFAFVEVPDGLCVTTEQHRWGVAPFHYVDEFYQYVLQQLATLGHNVLIPTGPTTLPVAEITHRGKTWRVAGTAPDDHIFRSLQSGHPYEADLLQSTAPLVHPGDVIIDVGANIGNHSAYWAVTCEAEVYAFEPRQACVQALRQTVRLNGLEGSVFIRAFGLGRRTSTARSESPQPANAGASVLVEDAEGLVTVRRLDDVLLPKPRSVRLIKIDVEGMELDVLAGAAETIDEHRPILVIECQDDQAFAAITEWVDAHGYRAREAFNASPTYVFVHEEFAYREEYTRVSHLEDVVARTSRRTLLDHNAAMVHWRLLGEHRERLDHLTDSLPIGDLPQDRNTGSAE